MVVAASDASPEGSAVSRLTLGVVVAVQFLALLTVAWLVGDNGWDDGVITLAFARTFGQHGVIALTPLSETVEGFSSLSWFALNALIALARPSYHVAIFASQLAAALCLCGVTVLLAKSCELLKLGSFATICTLFAFASWGASFSECVNGMEMGLLTAAFLVLLNEMLRTSPNPWVIGISTALIVSTRSEAVLYVAAVGVVLLAARRRRELLVLIAVMAAVLICTTAWRLAVFGDVMPNSIRAKMWPPYTAADLPARISSHFWGLLEFPRFFIVPGLLLLAFLRREVITGWRARWQALALLTAPAIGAIVTGALIGLNWGYLGRMPFFAFPCALLIIAILCSAWISGTSSRLRRVAVASIFVSSVVGSLILSFPVNALRLARAGDSAPGDVTPHTYAETGRIVERLTKAAGLDTATFLTPDVGGLALSCEDLRVVDLAMLSNRHLARDGYSALGDVLASESPHVIEAHGLWAALGRLYDLPTFQAGYVPTFAGRTRLWLRRDVANAIVSRREGSEVDLRGNLKLRDALSAHRYAHDGEPPADREAFEAQGAILLLHEPNASDP
jgi:hypothetical protein